MCHHGAIHTSTDGVPPKGREVLRPAPRERQTSAQTAWTQQRMVHCRRMVS